MKVVHSDDDERTIGDAMLQCSIEGGRLTASSSCEMTQQLMEELSLYFNKTTPQTYHVGNFAFKDGARKTYRNWGDDTVVDS